MLSLHTKLIEALRSAQNTEEGALCTLLAHKLQARLERWCLAKAVACRNYLDESYLMPVEIRSKGVELCWRIIQRYYRSAQPNEASAAGTMH